MINSINSSNDYYAVYLDEEELYLMIETANIMLNTLEITNNGNRHTTYKICQVRDLVNKLTRMEKNHD